MSANGVQEIKAGDVHETRIALAFYGGVALAVYESGVALEFFRLVKGEGAYARLHALLGRIRVDVITGTSAGGLNGAFLANALVNGGDMRKLLALWREEGDLDKLLFGLFTSQPPSLLDGERYRDKIFQALLVKRAESGPATSLQETLDLFLTATNLNGDRVEVTNPDGETIPTRTHRRVFTFRYRQKEPVDQGEAINDFATEEDLSFLALAARASSSFPLAFAPVLVAKGGLGQRAAEFEADSYHIDGGVLDNKPIALALQAVAHRRADRQITRRLFYIEPDPENIASRVGDSSTRSFSAIEVVLAALVSLPGYQSITSALQNIVGHNEDVAELRRTLDYYEGVASAYQSEGKPSTTPITETPLVQTVRYVLPHDGPTALFRAQEDGYLDLRLQKCVPPPLNTIVLQLAQSVVKNVPETKTVSTAAQAEALADSVAAELYRLKSLLLSIFDLHYHRRYYQYLVQEVLKLYPKKPAGTGSGQGAEWAFLAETTRALNRFKSFLYDNEASIARQAPVCEETTEAAQIASELQMLIEHVQPGCNPRELKQRLHSFFAAVESRPFCRARLQFLAQLRATTLLRLENEHARLLQILADAPGDPAMADFSRDLRAGYYSLRDTITSFYLRDLIIYPSMADGTIAGEMQPIHFSRISPSDADQFMPGLNPAEKLAGEQFAHFGGFMSEKWRGNDLTWGRLDAAEIIIRKLLPDLPAPEMTALIQRAQAEIMEEMNRLGMGISPAPAASANVAASPPNRQDLIGRQDLSAIPAEKKLQWGGRGLVTFLKITRQTLAQSSAASLLKFCFGVLDKLIWVLAFFFAGFTWLVARVFGGRIGKAFFCLLAAALLGYALWDNSLHHWWEYVRSYLPGRNPPTSTTR